MYDKLDALKEEEKAFDKVWDEVFIAYNRARMELTHRIIAEEEQVAKNFEGLAKEHDGKEVA